LLRISIFFLLTPFLAKNTYALNKPLRSRGRNFSELSRKNGVPPSAFDVFEGNKEGLKGIADRTDFQLPSKIAALARFLINVRSRREMAPPSTTVFLRLRTISTLSFQERIAYRKSMKSSAPVGRLRYQRFQTFIAHNRWYIGRVMRTADKQSCLVDHQQRWLHSNLNEKKEQRRKSKEKRASHLKLHGQAISVW